MRRNGFPCLLILMSLALGFASTEVQAADKPDIPAASPQTIDEDMVVLANGNILTMNPKQPTASAMAVEVKQGKIVAVGDLATVKNAAGNKYEYIDLEGKTVVPGFIESHDHIALWGSALTLLVTR